MGLETATFINGLVNTNPTDGDPKSEGDDHLRLLKSVLLSTFPNIAGAVNASHTEINHLVGVTTAVLHTASLAALPAAVGTTTPVAGTFSTLNATNSLSRAGVAVVDANRLVSTGNGLTGGGNLSANRTLSVVAGEGITVAAGSVALNTASTLNVAHSAVSIIAGNGLIGGGTIAANRTLTVGAGTGINVSASAVALDIGSTRNIDHGAVNVIAGTGLSGGGVITASRTFNLDFSALAAILPVNISSAVDGILISDAGVPKVLPWDEMGVPILEISAARTLVSADIGRFILLTGSVTRSFTVPTGLANDGAIILV